MSSILSKRHNAAKKRAKAKRKKAPQKNTPVQPPKTPSTQDNGPTPNKLKALFDSIDSGHVVSSVANTAANYSLSSGNPWLAAGGAVLKAGLYAYPYVSDQYTKRKSKAKKQQQRTLESAMQWNAVQDYYRMAYQRRGQENMINSLNAVKAKTFRDEVERNRIMASENYTKEKNRISQMYEDIQRFKKELDDPNSKLRAANTVQEITKKKELERMNKKQLRERRGQEIAIAYNDSPLDNEDMKTALTLFNQYMERAPTHLQQVRDTSLPKGSPIARADVINSERIMKNDLSKWNSSDQRMWETILQRPEAAQFMLTDMSTPMLFPELWASKMTDEALRKQWLANVKNIALATASTVIDLAKVLPSNESKNKALNFIHDKIGKLNLSEGYKSLLDKGADLIATKVFDTNKELVNKSEDTLSTIRDLVNVVSDNEVNTQVLVKRMERIEKETPKVEEYKLTDSDKAYINSFMDTSWYQKYPQGKNETEKLIYNLMENNKDKWKQKGVNRQDVYDFIEIMLNATNKSGGAKQGQPILLDKKEEKKLSDNINALGNNWQSVILKAGFGSDTERVNAQAKLNEAGLKNNEDIAKRKSMIESYYLAYGGDRDLSQMLEEMMFMNPTQFNRIMEQADAKEEDKRLKAGYAKSMDLLSALSSHRKELKQIAKERAVNQANLQKYKWDDSINKRFYDFRNMIFEDFDKDEFKHPEVDIMNNDDADRNRNTLLKMFFLTKTSVGSPREDIFLKWWNEKGKKIAVNDKGESIFSLKGNNSQDKRAYANKQIKKLMHDYVKYLQNNISEYPITIKGEKLAPGIQSETETIQENIMDYRNKFKFGSTKTTREFDRFDTYRQGIVEQAFSDTPEQMRDMLDNVSDRGMRTISIQGLQKMAEAAKRTKNPQELKIQAQSIMDAEKKKQELYKDMFQDARESRMEVMSSANRADFETSSDINPMFISSVNSKLLGIYDKLNKKDPKKAKMFAGWLYSTISDYYRQSTYIPMDEEHEAEYNTLVTQIKLQNELPTDEYPAPRRVKYGSRSVLVGRDKDSRNRDIIYVYDQEVSPYKMLYNDRQPAFPTEIDTEQLKLRGFDYAEPRAWIINSP